MNIVLTTHANKRASQRGIDYRQIMVCVEFGEMMHRTGITFFMLTKKCLKKLKHSFGTYLSRLDGLVVLGYHQNEECFVVTAVYKNSSALKTIKRKNKQRKVMI